jgi:hypothetical protein
MKTALELQGGLLLQQQQAMCGLQGQHLPVLLGEFLPPAG